MNVLRDLRKAAKLSQAALAKRAKTSQPQIKRLEASERKLTKEWAERLAPALGVDARALMFPEEQQAEVEKVETFKPTIVPGRELVGARDFPIYAAAEGGSGHLIISTEAVEFVRRPSILEGVKDAYGVLVSGDSMAPEFKHGDMALVHPGLPHQRDTAHVFYDVDEERHEAMIKNLVAWTESHWTIEQYNPAKKWKVDRIDWPKVHVVVGRYARRG